VKASAVISRARDLIGDPEVPYRWSDQVLLDWIFDAEVELQSIRPDSTMSSSIIPVAITRKNTLSQDLQTVDKFISCIVDFVCFRAMSRDAEHANNERLATSYYQQFTTKASML
jgi:hypothetical protein